MELRLCDRRERQTEVYRLADVFIVDEHRGNGLGVWLIEVITSHPQLQGFRRWLLATRDAHELYRRFGFEEVAEPKRWMERCRTEIFRGDD